MRVMTVVFAWSSLAVCCSALADAPDTVLLNGYEHCATPILLCPDGDNDGYGNTPWCINACERPYDFFAIPDGDCDDDDGAKNPGAPEQCNYLDDDCDLLIDEAFPLLGSSCATGQPGICNFGTETCRVDGSGTMCVQALQPSAEVCDGQDNNCNGPVDEDNPGGGQACNTGLPGVCQLGTTQCSNASLICNQNVQPSVEVCDGQDNNCNGQADENNPGGGSYCYTGQPGVCSDGVTNCANGALMCMRLEDPSPEICDGLDNDCDGNVDEGFPGCIPP